MAGGPTNSPTGSAAPGPPGQGGAHGSSPNHDPLFEEKYTFKSRRDIYNPVLGVAPQTKIWRKLHNGHRTRRRAPSPPFRRITNAQENPTDSTPTISSTSFSNPSIEKERDFRPFFFTRLFEENNFFKFQFHIFWRIFFFLQILGPLFWRKKFNGNDDKPFLETQW